MNKVILMGRLTRDPEVRYSQGNNAMCIANFSLAVDRRFKRQNDDATADFFNCTAFGKRGEFVEKYLKQGTKILLSGRIENNNYTNREGQKVYGMKVMVDEIEFAESKNAAAGESRDNSKQYYNQPTGDDGFMHIPDDVSDEELPWN